MFPPCSTLLIFNVSDKPCQAAFPSVICRFRTITGTVVRKERMRRPGINDEFRRPAAGPNCSFHFPSTDCGKPQTLPAVQTENGSFDLSCEIEGPFRTNAGFLFRFDT